MRRILFIVSVLFLSSNSFATFVCDAYKTSVRNAYYSSAEKLTENYCKATYFQDMYANRLKYPFYDEGITKLEMNICKTNAEETKEYFERIYPNELLDCKDIHQKLSHIR